MPHTFSISTPSRHPAIQNGYDSGSHRYRAEYVKPESWILDLDASPGLPKNPAGIVQVPADVISFSWQVTRVGVGKPFSIADHLTHAPIWKTQIKIPTPGEYEVSLHVNFAGGRSETTTRHYTLRDFLIVGIGDSFAAGQGNPDVPATPSLDDQALCEATTVLLAITKVKEKVTEFAQQLEQAGKEKIEDYLPFVGKIVVGEINGVENVVGFVKGKIEDLGDTVIDFGKDVATATVEGVKEFVSIFGVGDGGESDKIISRAARWQEPNAYRSYRSGHSLAARQIERESEFGADRVTFLSFARTGSDITGGLLGPRTIDPDLVGDLSSLSIDGWTRHRGQVQEAKDTVLDRPIDALIISVGVNDLGFSSTIVDSLLTSGAQNRRDLADKLEKKLEIDGNPPNGQVPRDFDRLKMAIDSELKPRHVYITEYPAGLFTKLDENNRVVDGGPCDVFSSSVKGLDLDLQDGAMIRRLAQRLNGVVCAKADQFGWTFIGGIEHGCNGHGYCATPDNQRYFVKAQESCLNQGDFEGMLHPNQRGHEVTRDCIAQALRRDLLNSQENWFEAVLNVMMS